MGNLRNIASTSRSLTSASSTKAPGPPATAPAVVGGDRLVGPHGDGVDGGAAGVEPGAGCRHVAADVVGAVADQVRHPAPGRPGRGVEQGVRMLHRAREVGEPAGK